MEAIFVLEIMLDTRVAAAMKADRKSLSCLQRVPVLLLDSWTKHDP